MVAEQSDLNPNDYAVWGILQDCVYNHALPDHGCGREEWDRLDQEVIENAISE